MPGLFCHAHPRWHLPLVSDLASADRRYGAACGKPPIIKQQAASDGYRSRGGHSVWKPSPVLHRYAHETKYTAVKKDTPVTATNR
jgi:hypothetical protein